MTVERTAHRRRRAVFASPAILAGKGRPKFMDQPEALVALVILVVVAIIYLLFPKN